MLSRNVATALRLHIGEEPEETAIFLEMFDKFFDSLNVTNYTTCIIFSLQYTGHKMISD